MIKPICKDIHFLQKKSQPAIKSDLPIAADLIDTLNSHNNVCIGMAANMIGMNKRIIAVNIDDKIIIPLINPIIEKASKPYMAEENCLSLTGSKSTTRYQSIVVSYLDSNFKKHKQTFTGLTAQIIQHEIDHCNGILI